MSDSNISSAELQAEIAGLEMIQLEVMCDCAALALLVYEYLLTSRLERSHIWARKKSIVFYLFVALRYSKLLEYVFECLSDFIPFTSNTGCTAVLSAYAAADVVNAAALSAIFLLRIWAIWDKSTAVLLGVGSLLVSRVVLAAMIYVGDKDSISNGAARLFTTCEGGLSPIGIKSSMAESISIVVFDMAVLLLTVVRTAQQVRESARLGLKRGLSYFVIRDGVLYFLTIEAMVIAIVVLDQMTNPEVGSFATILQTFQSILEPILAQRLILNLRQVEEELQNPTHVSLNIGELNFAHDSIIGNIGAPLRVDEDHGVDDEAVEGRAEVVDLDAIQEVPRQPTA